MAGLTFSDTALADLERIVDRLAIHSPAAAKHVLDLIYEALSILNRHPLIGRFVEDGLRELVISHGKSGYVALYSYEAANDTALILAIRHQREAGFLPWT